MNRGKSKKSKVILITAHPDDETLWAGGTVLLMKSTDCFIISLCRGSDTDRAPKFRKVLKELGAKGAIGDLEDGPEQHPLEPGLIGRTILNLLPDHKVDMIYTHSPLGEYTRHQRHEETGREVLNLWLEGRLQAGEIRLFAYDDALKTTLPGAIPSAPVQTELPGEIWEKKFSIITETYGFTKDSFEARTTPRTEAFWQIRTSEEARTWIEKDREK